MYPTRTSIGAALVRAMLSGNISRKTVPSMKPEPSAMKYRSDFRARLFETTIRPPITLASAAASANDSDCRKEFIGIRGSALRASSAVPDGHDVAVLDEVFFSFQPQQSFFF